MSVCRYIAWALQEYALLVMALADVLLDAPASAVHEQDTALDLELGEAPPPTYSREALDMVQRGSEVQNQSPPQSPAPLVGSYAWRVQHSRRTP